MRLTHAHVSVWLIAKFFLNSVKFEFFLGSNYPNLVVCGLCGAIPLGRHSDLKNRLIFSKCFTKWAGYSAPSSKSCMILPKFAPKFMLYLMFCRHFRKKFGMTEGHKRLKYQFWSLKNDIGHQNHILPIFALPS